MYTDELAASRDKLKKVVRPSKTPSKSSASSSLGATPLQKRSGLAAPLPLRTTATRRSPGGCVKYRTVAVWCECRQSVKKTIFLFLTARHIDRAKFISAKLSSQNRCSQRYKITQTFCLYLYLYFLFPQTNFFFFRFFRFSIFFLLLRNLRCLLRRRQPRTQRQTHN